MPMTLQIKTRRAGHWVQRKTIGAPARPAAAVLSPLFHSAPSGGDCREGAGPADATPGQRCMHCGPPLSSDHLPIGIKAGEAPSPPPPLGDAPETSPQHAAMASTRSRTANGSDVCPSFPLLLPLPGQASALPSLPLLRSAARRRPRWWQRQFWGE